MRTGSRRVAEVLRPPALLPFGSRFVAAGDSITDNGAAEGSSLGNFIGRGYWPWAIQACRGRIVPAYHADAGISGNSSTQLLARFATDVTDKAPKVVVIHIGTNDISAGTATATTIGNIRSMVAACRAIGVLKIYLYKVFPRGSTGTPMTGGQITAWETINAAIATMAAADVTVLDAEPYIGNMDSQHTILAGHTTSEDLLHPNTIGGQKASIPLTNAVMRDFEGGELLLTNNNDSRNFIPNGFFTGSGGTLGGTASGTVPTGWIAATSSGLGATMAVSVIPRTAYGQWAQITVSGTYNGANGGLILYRQWTSSVLANRRLQARMEFEVDAGHTSFAGLEMRNVINAYSFASMAPYTGETAGPAGAYSGILVTPPFQVLADQTSFATYVRVNLLDVGGDTSCGATVRIGRAEMVDVTDITNS